jgi:hypothetical protein
MILKFFNIGGALLLLNANYNIKFSSDLGFG